MDDDEAPSYHGVPPRQPSPSLLSSGNLPQSAFQGPSAPPVDLTGLKKIKKQDMKFKKKDEDRPNDDYDSNEDVVNIPDDDISDIQFIQQVKQEVKQEIQIDSSDDSDPDAVICELIRRKPRRPPPSVHNSNTTTSGGQGQPVPQTNLGPSSTGRPSSSVPESGGGGENQPRSQSNQNKRRTSTATNSLAETTSGNIPRGGINNHVPLSSYVSRPSPLFTQSTASEQNGGPEIIELDDDEINSTTSTVPGRSQRRTHRRAPETATEIPPNITNTKTNSPRNDREEDWERDSDWENHRSGRAQANNGNTASANVETNASNGTVPPSTSSNANPTVTETNPPTAATASTNDGNIVDTTSTTDPKVNITVIYDPAQNFVLNFRPRQGATAASVNPTPPAPTDPASPLPPIVLLSGACQTGPSIINGDFESEASTSKSKENQNHAAKNTATRGTRGSKDSDSSDEDDEGRSRKKSKERRQDHKRHHSNRDRERKNRSRSRSRDRDRHNRDSSSSPQPKKRNRSGPESGRDKYVAESLRRQNLREASVVSELAAAPLFDTPESLIKLILSCKTCKRTKPFPSRREGVDHQKKKHNKKYCPCCFHLVKFTGNFWKDHLNRYHAVKSKDSAGRRTVEMATCPFCREPYRFEGLYTHIGQAHLRPLEKQEQQEEDPPILERMPHSRPPPPTAPLPTRSNTRVRVPPPAPQRLNPPIASHQSTVRNPVTSQEQSRTQGPPVTTRPRPAAAGNTSVQRQTTDNDRSNQRQNPATATTPSTQQRPTGPALFRIPIIPRPGQPPRNSSQNHATGSSSNNNPGPFSANLPGPSTDYRTELQLEAQLDQYRGKKLGMHEIAYLKSKYAQNRTPDGKELRDISIRLKACKTAVTHWFNTRYKKDCTNDAKKQKRRNY